MVEGCKGGNLWHFKARGGEWAKGHKGRRARAQVGKLCKGVRVARADVKCRCQWMSLPNFGGTVTGNNNGFVGFHAYSRKARSDYREVQQFHSEADSGKND